MIEDSKYQVEDQACFACIYRKELEKIELVDCAGLRPPQMTKSECTNDYGLLTHERFRAGCEKRKTKKELRAEYAEVAEAAKPKCATCRAFHEHAEGEELGDGSCRIGPPSYVLIGDILCTFTPVKNQHWCTQHIYRGKGEDR